MSVHISAAAGEIAPKVLLAGDPLRAKFIAENFLSEAKLVSSVRNMLYFTGSYQGKQVTVGGSGMGCASIGIYSYELYQDYGVDAIMRIGTCGAYTEELQLFDLINVSSSASESTYAKYAWGIEGDLIHVPGKLYHHIAETAVQEGIELKGSSIHCSDIFYRATPGVPEIAQKYCCPAVEMETFALFSNAQFLKKDVACLLTVSDIIPTKQLMSAEQREKALEKMILLALKSV